MSRISEKWQERIWGLVTSVFLCLLCYPLPSYKPAYSRVLYADDGALLSAALSTEAQWCFPGSDEVPENFATCLRVFEDEYMAFHPGINPVSVIKSAILNAEKGRIARGASTLAMQIMRMKNRNPKRTWYQKILEIIGAVKLSLLLSDNEIIRVWASMAPFGGNTIGLNAAALRYFGRPADQLSVAETALLAVLPNNPSGANLMINRDQLLKRRNGLLQKLRKKEIIREEEFQRYLSEPLPSKRYDITQRAFHLLNHLSNTYANTYVYQSTISAHTQQLTQDLLVRESEFLRQEDIRNLAMVVLDTEKDCVVAYHGNVPKGDGSFSYVDIVQSPRSTGSLLKPLLYLHVLESGLMLPREMVPDIPIAFGDFQPQNFDKKFRGAVGLDEMVIQSLNVPAVQVLQRTGLQSFYDKIQQLQIGHLNRGAHHYGLSLILGGGETSLWEICRLYKGISRNASGYSLPFGAVRILKDRDPYYPLPKVSFSPGPLNYTLQVMSDVKRPREEKHWSVYGNQQEVAWKTGTSYGHKDGWAVGFNGKYLVGVWVGNEDGEGRFDLTGISRAAPIMFQVFRLLPQGRLAVPSGPIHQQKVKFCRHSGKRAGPMCTDVGEVGAQGFVLGLDMCQWHQIAETDSEGRRVVPGCPAPAVRKDTFFVLPTRYEYYYKAGHPEYAGLPEADPRCQSTTEGSQIMYPREGMTIFLPRKNENQSNELILEAYHRREDALLYWYDNQNFLGNTAHGSHRLPASLQAGKHQLTILDQWGNQSKVTFQVVK